MAEAFGHGQDLPVVQAASHHHVDLDRREPGLGRGVDAAQHVVGREAAVAHALEHGRVQRIQADGDTREPGALERLGLARQHAAVGGQGQVQRAAGGRAQVGQLAHQVLDMLAQQRLAARQADLLHAQLREDARQAADFLERQQRRMRHEGVAAVEDFARHAVGAAEVAAVRDRNPQVAQGTRALVQRGLSVRRQFAGRQRAAAAIGKKDHFAHGSIISRRIAFRAHGKASCSDCSLPVSRAS